MENITLHKTHYENIIAHSRFTLPYEAVGIIAGNINGESISVFPLINELKEENSFFVNPYSQFKVLKLIKDSKLIPLAQYHSHPEGLPILSQSDIHFASKHDVIQIVIALNVPGINRELVKAYRVNYLGETKEICLVIK